MFTEQLLLIIGLQTYANCSEFLKAWRRWKMFCWGKGIAGFQQQKYCDAYQIGTYGNHADDHYPMKQNGVKEIRMNEKYHNAANGRNPPSSEYFHELVI